LIPSNTDNTIYQLYIVEGFVVLFIQHLLGTLSPVP